MLGVLLTRGLSGTVHEIQMRKKFFGGKKHYLERNFSFFIGCFLDILVFGGTAGGCPFAW